MDESCCTYERGMSHTCRGLVTNVKELCRKEVVSHRRGYVTLTKKFGFFISTHMKEMCHTYKRVMKCI